MSFMTYFFHLAYYFEGSSFHLLFLIKHCVGGVVHMSAVPMEARRGHWIYLDLQLSMVVSCLMWVLGI